MSIGFRKSAREKGKENAKSRGHPGKKKGLKGFGQEKFACPPTLKKGGKNIRERSGKRIASRGFGG